MGGMKRRVLKNFIPEYALQKLAVSFPPHVHKNLVILSASEGSPSTIQKLLRQFYNV
jgi:hypothetical protein